MLELIELCYIANNGDKREKNQIICLSKLSKLEYYLKLSYKEQIISKKKFKEKMKIKNLEYINNIISKEKYLGVRNSYK